MNHLYFLLRQEGASSVFHPIDEQDEIAEWQQKAALILSAVLPTNEWGVSVIFPRLLSNTTLMYSALDQAITLARHNIHGEAVPDQVDNFLRRHWTELAFGAYENFQAIGKGCYVFIEGIIKGNSF